MQIMVLFLQNFWLVIVEAAPWLLFGFFLAGVINQFTSQQWITQYLGAKGSKSVIRAALLGAPLPLCSCGIIPSAMGIHRAGASKGATTSFLVSTPETGVDSISLTYALMGPVMAIARPIAAVFSGIVSGLFVDSLTKNDAPEKKEGHLETSCSHGHHHHHHHHAAEHHTDHQKTKGTFLQRQQRTLEDICQFGFGQLFDDIIYWLIIGLIGAALVKTFVPADFFTEWGSGIWAMLLVIVVGIPMYICATASTPLAASFMLAGVSPGVALVFMLVGPATNIATLAMVKKELGSKALWGYLIGVIFTAISTGLLLDSLPINLSLSISHEHLHMNYLSVLCGIILVSLTSYKVLNKNGILLNTLQQKMSR